MRILHVLSCPAAGGAEIYVRDLAILLRERGHEVTIAFLNHAKAVERDATYEEKFTEQLRNAGVDVRFVAHSESKTGLLWRGALVARKLVAELRPDVCHCHSYKTAFIFGLWTSPCILTIHFTIDGNQKRHTWPLGLLDRVVDGYVAISDASRLNVARHTRRPVFQITNARKRPTCAAPRCRSVVGTQSLEGRPVRLLAVGRLVPEKNYPQLIEIAHLLAKRGCDFELIIAGEGTTERKSKLTDLAASFQLGNIIRFIGQVDDIWSVMIDADVFVMTSSSEGLPITLIEAQFGGLPSVVTDVGACREVIERCESGYLVPAGDSHAFAEQLARLIADPQLRQAMGSLGRENSGFYEIDRAVNNHLGLYESLNR